MQTKHLSAMLTFVLTLTLLAGCAAPAAAPTAMPVPPTATPVPPEPVVDPAAAARAWMDAITAGDVDAALALVSDEVSFRFGGEGGIGPTMMGGHLNWWAGIDTKYHIFDCQTDDDKASCNVDIVDGCIAVMGYPDGLPMQIKFVVEQDGEIGEISAPTVGPEWDDYWRQVSLGTAWMQAYRAEELAKRDWSREYGPTQLKMCQDFAIAKQTQAPATAKAAQDFVDAVNSGDADAALGIFADEPKFQFWNDKAAGVEDVRSILDWMVGKEARLKIADCEWVGTGTQCVLSVSDGCMKAYGASDSLPGKMNFYSLEDGALRQVVGFLGVAERKAYNGWLEAETAWASANRADEFAQAEGYSQEAGAMAVKLCQEYATAPKLDGATVAKIEGLLNDQMQPNDVPGYAMCVVKEGGEVYSKGFGVAELGADRPVTPQSVFAIASTTKSFTGVALMQLVEQGKVDLDAPATAYLPYFEMADPRFEDITVRMLASHTSGLTDEAVTATLPESVEPTAVDEALDWYVRSLSDDTLTAAPGETWQYATVNFSILGDLIGKVSGVPYDQYVVQNILEPLKMTHSTFDVAAIPPDTLVGEYTTGEDAVVNAMPVSQTSRIELPAGGLYSTCEDMTRWMQVNLNRGELDGVRILKPETYDILWKVEAPTGLDEFFGAWAGEYGLGWGVAEDGGHFLAGHPGGGAGQTTGFQLAPDDNLGVTVLANWGTDSNYPAWMAAADVIYALLGIGQ